MIRGFLLIAGIAVSLFGNLSWASDLPLGNGSPAKGSPTKGSPRKTRLSVARQPGSGLNIKCVLFKKHRKKFGARYVEDLKGLLKFSTVNELVLAAEERSKQEITTRLLTELCQEKEKNTRLQEENGGLQEEKKGLLGVVNELIAMQEDENEKLDTKCNDITVRLENLQGPGSEEMAAEGSPDALDYDSNIDSEEDELEKENGILRQQLKAVTQDYTTVLEKYSAVLEEKKRLFEEEEIKKARGDDWKNMFV